MSRYIDADALKSKLEGVLKDCAGTGLFSIDSLILIADTLQMIETEPTANVQEEKRGKWENDVCTYCGIEAPGFLEKREYDDALQLAVHLYDYCPHCGAKMDLEEEEK